MKRVLSIILTIAIVLSLNLFAYAHSGGTDSNGGHKDNKNVSGLGAYHYHHGYGPHLHTGGICPYNQEEPSLINNSKDNYGSKDIVLPSSASKPTFPVLINNVNLNNTKSGYYPIVIEGITYIPLTSDVISLLNLRGGWNKTEGLVLKSK